MSDSRIAIIGMACRFPGASTPGELYALLSRGGSGLTRFSREELLEAGVPAEALDHRSYVPVGGDLPGAASFDAEFFGLSGREAAAMDPQHRLLLTCAWEAFEDAGHRPSASPDTAVFASCSIGSYFFRRLMPRLDDSRPTSFLPALIAGDKDYAATRIAYALDLRGPALTIQTACSSSLVAVATACDSLLSYACDFALAGGASVRLPLRSGYVYEEGAILSPDGVCRPFSVDCGGTVYGQGAGVVLLRRLEDALAAGDRIYAVIDGYAINNDGGGKAGYVAPSVEGQAACVAAAVEHADVDPANYRFVECHGTATLVGDEIEVEALRRVLSAAGSEPCHLGSIKSNLGHLDAAAGVAGLMKAGLAAYHGILPQSINVSAPAPPLDQASERLSVAVEPVKLPERAVGGVSSFGIGGTNAHVVISRPPVLDRAAASGAGPAPIHVLSARSRDGLAGLIEASRIRLAGDGFAPADAAFTSCVGRERFEFTRAIAAETVDQLDRGLSRLLERGLDQKPARADGIAWVFTGHGSERLGMGATLYERLPQFREWWDRCDQIVRAMTGITLAEACWKDDATLRTPEHAQLGIVSLEVCLAELLRSWGLRPASVAGHSLGEIAAAIVAQVFSLEEGLRLVHARARAMRELSPEGRVLICWHDVEDVRSCVAEMRAGAWVNGVIGPRQASIAGSLAAIAAVEERLAGLGWRTTHGRVRFPFHTPMMADAAERIRRELGSLRFGAADGGFVPTSVTEHAPTSGDYWFEQVTAPFDISQMTTAGIAVEIGATPHLTVLARDRRDRTEWIPTLTGREPEAREVGTAVARLVEAGADVDWHAYYAGSEARRCSLPTYPFEEREHWLAEEAPRKTAPAGRAAMTDVPGFGRLTWIDAGLPGFASVLDHVVLGQPFFPATGYLGAIREAMGQPRDDEVLVVEGLSIQEPWPLEARSWSAQLQLREESEDGCRAVECYRFVNDSARRLATGSVRTQPAGPGQLDTTPLSEGETHDQATLYRMFEERGIDYGPAFRVIDRTVHSGGRASSVLIARVAAPAAALDAALQTLAVAADRLVDDLYLPTTFGEVVFHSRRTATHVHATARYDGERDVVVGDIVTVDADGRACAEFREVTCRRAGAQVRTPAELLRVAHVAEASAGAGRDADVVVVSPGTDAAALWPGSATVFVEDTDGIRLESYVESLRDKGVERPAIVDLRALARERDGRDLLAATAELLRTLARSAYDIACVVVTRRAADDPHRSAVWSLGSSVALEPSRLTLTMVDIDDDGADLKALVRAELGNERSHQVIYRDGRRFVQRVTGVAASSAPALIEHAVKQPGAWIVTGASGGLAPAVVAWLAGLGVTDLVLQARSWKPLARAAFDGLQANCRFVEGGFDGSERVAGVVHLAGAVDDGLFAQSTPRRLDTVLRAKTEGLRELHERTRADRPFFLLFSSLAAVTGSPGQAEYASANGFLTGFAQWRAAQGFPTLAVSWGPFDHQGMARRLGLERFRRTGLPPMPVSEALGVLSDLRQDAPAHVIVASVNRKVFARANDGRVAAILGSLDEHAGQIGVARGALRDRLLTTPATLRERLLAQEIAREVAAAVGVAAERIDVHLSFVDSGIDSLVTAELRSRLEYAIDLPLNVGLFFDHDTPGRLAAALLPLIAQDAGVDPPAGTVDLDIAGMLRARLGETG
jgi:acyl transferase domain-containing protein